MASFRVLARSLESPAHFLAFAVSVENFALKSKIDGIQINFQIKVAAALAVVGHGQPAWTHPVLARDAALVALARSCKTAAVAAKLALEIRPIGFLGALALFAYQAQVMPQEVADHAGQHARAFADAVMKAAKSELPQMTELADRLIRNLNGLPEGVVRELGTFPEGCFDYRGFLRYACLLLQIDQFRAGVAGMRDVFQRFVEHARLFVRGTEEFQVTAGFVLLWRALGRIRKTEEIAEFMKKSFEFSRHPELVEEAMGEMGSQAAHADRHWRVWPLSDWLPEISGNVLTMPCS
jgi:hypothetical protein